jgi:hypothetical protein
MKNQLIIALSLLCLTGCSSESNSENEALQKDVIAVHDEVMPLMGTFVRNEMLIDSLLNNMPALIEKDPSLDTNAQKVRLGDLKTKLESSTDAMNKWMQELSLDYEGMSDQEVKSYLEEEKRKVEKINRQFKETDAESKEVLAPYQP